MAAALPASSLMQDPCVRVSENPTANKFLDMKPEEAKRMFDALRPPDFDVNKLDPTIRHYATTLNQSVATASQMCSMERYCYSRGYTKLQPRATNCNYLFDHAKAKVEQLRDASTEGKKDAYKIWKAIHDEMIPSSKPPGSLQRGVID